MYLKYIGAQNVDINLMNCLYLKERKMTKEEKLHEESQLIRKDFLKYFDMEITFNDLDSTLEEIKGTLEKLQSETQWVPRNWVFS